MPTFENYLDGIPDPNIKSALFNIFSEIFIRLEQIEGDVLCVERKVGIIRQPQSQE